MNALHLEWAADPPILPADTPDSTVAIKLSLKVDGDPPPEPLILAVGVVGEMIGTPSRTLAGVQEAICALLGEGDKLILLGADSPDPLGFKEALRAAVKVFEQVNPNFNRRLLLLVHGQELITPGSYEILTESGIGLDVITLDPDVEQGAFVRFTALLGGEALAVNPSTAIHLATRRVERLLGARYPGGRLKLSPQGPLRLERLYRLSPSPVFLGDLPPGDVDLELGPLNPAPIEGSAEPPIPSWILTATLPRLHVGLYEALVSELSWVQKGERRVEKQTLLLPSSAEASDRRAARADIQADWRRVEATAWVEEILLALKRADGRRIINCLDQILQHLLAFEAFETASEIEALRIRFLRRGMLRLQDINRLRRLIAAVRIG